MTVISIASDKSGESRTSLALLVGAEAALDEYKVCIVDSDVNQQAAAFGEKAHVPGCRSVAALKTPRLKAFRPEGDKASSR
jgi:chromosome partitioning protein